MCVLTSVEPCWSLDIYKNRAAKKLDLVKRERHCLFLYHYWVHPVFGFMNARIQSWFPFPIQICFASGRQKAWFLGYRPGGMRRLGGA